MQAGHLIYSGSLDWHDSGSPYLGSPSFNIGITIHRGRWVIDLAYAWNLERAGCRVCAGASLHTTPAGVIGSLFYQQDDWLLPTSGIFSKRQNSVIS
jgi:hypothetical protein